MKHCQKWVKNKMIKNNEPTWSHPGGHMESSNSLSESLSSSLSNSSELSSSSSLFCSEASSSKIQITYDVKLTTSHI